MERINVALVCKMYNEVRDEYKGKVGSPSWTSEILRKKGLSVNMVKRILREPTLIIPSQRKNAGKGNYKGCMFPYNPIHVTWFQNWLYGDKKNEKKDLPFEEECTNYLKARGYEIKKCIGFDEDRFAEEHPDLYKQYLVYECI